MAKSNASGSPEMTNKAVEAAKAAKAGLPVPGSAPKSPAAAPAINQQAPPAPTPPASTPAPARPAPPTPPAPPVPPVPATPAVRMHKITEEDMALNPQFAAEGKKVGDLVPLSVSTDTEDKDEDDDNEEDIEDDEEDPAEGLPDVPAPVVPIAAPTEPANDTNPHTEGSMQLLEKDLAAYPFLANAGYKVGQWLTVEQLQDALKAIPYDPTLNNTEVDKAGAIQKEQDALHAAKLKKYGEGYVEAMQMQGGKRIDKTFPAEVWASMAPKYYGWRQVVKVPQEVQDLQKEK